MGFTLTAADERKLVGVAPPLVAVVRRAAFISPHKFVVLEGVRNLARQRKLLALGATQTLNSKHLSGRAVDIAPLDERGKVSWHWPHYHKLALYVKNAAADLKTPIQWGGDWRNFKDGPHWELR